MELPCLPCQSVEVRGHNARKGRTATLECGAQRGGEAGFSSAFQSYVSFILDSASQQEPAELPGGTAFLKCRNRQAARRVVSTGPPACGWLRGTSRTSPGPPRRWRRPVRLQGTSARGRGFAAYLPGCARQLLTVRYAHYAEGASLTTFGFVTTVPRYLPKASNSLTFVRGADRACCAPRKWLCRPPDALPVLDRPHAPRRGIGVRTRQRHVAAVRGADRACCALRKWLCRPTNALQELAAAQPRRGWSAHPAAAPCRRTPPGGALACVLGSGTCPPVQSRRAWCVASNSCGKLVKSELCDMFVSI